MSASVWENRCDRPVWKLEFTHKKSPPGEPAGFKVKISALLQ
jgi:hypothetical protein